MNKTVQRYEPNFSYVIDTYSGKKIELDYETPFQLLCAVILSAQTTDKQVNRITPPLFARVREAADMENISLKEIEDILQYINFFRNKSRFIRETGIILAREYQGIIPNDVKILQTLPGVGVKTAKVVLGVLYDAPYVGVDTHIHRVVNRWGLVNTNTANETDRVLDRLLPIELKRQIHHPLVLFGRYHCTARNPSCKNCQLRNNCKYWKKLNKRPKAS